MRRIKKTNIVNSIGTWCRSCATPCAATLRAFTTPSQILRHALSTGIRGAALALVCVVSLAVAPRMAIAYDPLDFVPDQVAAARLYGSALLRRYGRPVYDIKLFVDLGTFSADDLSRESFALDLEYRNDHTANHLASEFAGQMADQGIANGAQIRVWQRQLTQFLPTVQPGDHLTAVFRPNEGTQFFLNGEPVGKIAGNEFCRAFFGIWLDTSTTMPSVRSRLLKGAG